MRKIIGSFFFALMSVVTLYAQYPSVTNRIYWPGIWRPEQSWGQYQLGYCYEDSFNVTWGVIRVDPGVGYPYYTGNTLGINDTAKVGVFFDNRLDEELPIAYESPETWFYPVLYDPYVDVFKSPPLADTSAFEYRFEHWTTPGGLLTPKPDTLFSLPKRGWNKGYGIIYSIWGVGPGTYRVILKPTSAKPEYVQLSLDTENNYFIMTQGQNILDTLNSYATIALNALFRREMTLFSSYVDSIFYRNPQSLTGWALRYHGYSALADTTNALAALDSVLNIITNHLDPLIPDSSKMTPVHGSWLMQWDVDYSYYKSRMLYPERWRYRIPR